MRLGNWLTAQLGFHRSARNAVFQGRTVQKLHGDECVAVPVVNFVDGTNVRMIQCRGSLGFALKAAECLRVLGYVVGQELEGDEPTELYILSLVDDTHATATEFFNNAVMGDGLADHLIGPECYVEESGKSMKIRSFNRTWSVN